MPVYEAGVTSESKRIGQARRKTRSTRSTRITGNQSTRSRPISTAVEQVPSQRHTCAAIAARVASRVSALGSSGGSSAPLTRAMLARVCLRPADALEPEAEASGSAGLAASPPPSGAAAELQRELRHVRVAAFSAEAKLGSALLAGFRLFAMKGGYIRRVRPRSRPR